ncbi:hypothetical protein ACFL31_01115 [Candidatus Margulisiibacteriota bacterium]
MTLQILIPILIGIVLGGLLFFLLSRLLRHRSIAPAGNVPRFSEESAERLLKNAGYAILGKGIKETVITKVDGKDHFGFLEADYTVRGGRRKYVVVVLTGEGSADPNEPIMRRQLLEYARVFRRYGVLVLDLNNGRIHEISFKFPHERNIDFFFQFLIGLFIIGVVIGIIWIMVQLRLF